MCIHTQITINLSPYEVSINYISWFSTHQLYILKRNLWSATYVDNSYITYKLTLVIYQLVYISWGLIHIISIPPSYACNTQCPKPIYIYKYTHVPIAISNNELYQSISHLNNEPSVSNHLSFTPLFINIVSKEFTVIIYTLIPMLILGSMLPQFLVRFISMTSLLIFFVFVQQQNKHNQY